MTIKKKSSARNPHSIVHNMKSSVSDVSINLQISQSGSIARVSVVEIKRFRDENPHRFNWRWNRQRDLCLIEFNFVSLAIEMNKFPLNCYRREFVVRSIIHEIQDFDVKSGKQWKSIIFSEHRIIKF